MKGIKHDQDKPRWSLIPGGTLEKVLAVLEYGARKYAPDNWKHVPNARERYYNAAMRHIDAWWQDPTSVDDESGLSHLPHAVCCLLFLIFIEDETQDEEISDHIRHRYPSIRRGLGRS